MSEGEAIALLLTLIAVWVLLAFMAMSRPAETRCPECGAVIWADMLRCSYCGITLK